MRLSDLFEALSLGELTNLSMSNNGSGTIRDADKPKLVNYANEALLRLYSRFPLKENDILVQLYEHITFYHLIPRFAVQYAPGPEEFDEPIRYLLDLPAEPFKDELLKVTTIYDGKGIEIPLNDEEKHNSCFTPQAKVLQVPNPRDETFLTVRYLQRHRKLKNEPDEWIACPEVLVGALTSYIAYKVFSHMNTADSNAKAQEFMGMYEAVCTEATDRDLVSSSISQSNVRFARGGWI